MGDVDRQRDKALQGLAKGERWPVKRSPRERKGTATYE